MDTLEEYLLKRIKILKDNINAFSVGHLNDTREQRLLEMEFALKVYRGEIEDLFIKKTLETEL